MWGSGVFRANPVENDKTPAHTKAGGPLSELKPAAVVFPGRNLTYLYYLSDKRAGGLDKTCILKGINQLITFLKYSAHSAETTAPLNNCSSVTDTLLLVHTFMKKRSA
jgi:hypothetical protein